MRKPAPECRVVTERSADGLTARVFLLDPRTGRKAHVFNNLRPHEIDAAVRKAKAQLLAAGDRISFAEG